MKRGLKKMIARLHNLSDKESHNLVEHMTFEERFAFEMFCKKYNLDNYSKWHPVTQSNHGRVVK